MKNRYLFSIGVLIATNLQAQLHDGPRYAAIFKTVAIPGSSATWSDPGNAEGSDDKYASFGDLNGTTGIYTDYLVATDFNFTIPAASVILGIVVEVEQSDPNGYTSDFQVRIVKGGFIGSAERAAATAFTATDTYLTYGSSSDLWGETWGYKNINDNIFGVAISAQRNAEGGTTEGQIDDIRITVYYSGILPVNLVSFSANKNHDAVQLNWTTAEESGMDHYDVERSSDGRNFYPIFSIRSNNQNATNHYSFTDNSPLYNISYYRLKMTGNGGFNKYSKIISLQWSTGNNVSLFPNPLVRGETLHISNPDKEELTIRFYNLAGKMLLSLTIFSDEIINESLNQIKGTLIYRVANSSNQTIGSGQIVLK